MRLNKKKIFLGTAQFLSNYGIVNHNKDKSKKYFFKILEYAAKNKILNYDTAPGYSSEKLLGEFISANNIAGSKITTKIPKIKSSNYKNFVEKSIEKSMKNLNSTIYTLFFHDISDVKIFLKNPSFFFKLKKKFQISNLGFSVYKPSDIEEIIKNKYNISIQFPFNILNQSFEPSLKNKKLSPLFARSIFLQGILLKKIIKKKNNSILVNSVNNYLNYLKYKNISPLEFTLSFIHQYKKIDYFIFGIEHINQLKKIISCDFSRFNNVELEKIKPMFNKKIVDPRNW